MPVATLKKQLARLQLGIRNAQFGHKSQNDGVLIITEDDPENIRLWEKAITTVKTDLPIRLSLLRISNEMSGELKNDSIHIKGLKINGAHKNNIEKTLHPEFIINALRSNDPQAELFISRIQCPYRIRHNHEYQKFYNFILNTKEWTALSYLNQFVQIYKTIKK